jgi:hypothetical protein
MAGSGGTTEPAAVRAFADAGRKESSHPWKEGWRSLFLLGAAVVLAVLGYTFWLASAVGKENASLEASTPLVIGVFSTDPGVTVHLTTVVFWHDISDFAKPPFAQVYVSATDPHSTSSSAILITSTVQSSFVASPGNQLIPDSSYKSAAFYSGVSPFSALETHEYVTVLSLKSLEPSHGNSQSGVGLGTQYGVQVGFFGLTQVTQESNGSFFAHLPDIGLDPILSDQLPVFISEHSSPAQPENFIEDPYPKNNANLPTTGYANFAPSDYQAPPGQQLQTAYWAPASLTAMEILEEVKPEVDNATVDSIVPDGSLQGLNYVWQGEGELEPTMSLTNRDAAASHSTWSFFSGIFFGVAAGTFVAFVQEEKNPLLRRAGRFLKRSGGQ